MSFIEIANVSKRFGATLALQGVDLSIGRGEVHGLLGENGAGKSTFTKILAGVLAPDSGSLHIDGADIAFGKPQRSRKAGLAMAYQELSAPLNITVAEKLFLPMPPRNALGIVSRRRLYSAASEILSDWGKSNIDPRAPIGELDLADKQHVEIISALARKPKLLILDEPTASLPDAEWLFGCIERITASGASVIYISHKLAEITRICDHGTVLRNGKVVKQFEPAGVTDHDLVEFMIGRSLDLVFPEKKPRPPSQSKPAIDITELHVGKNHGISAQIFAGEIVGLAGLEGQGQKDLFYCLAGLIESTAGTVEITAEGAENARRPFSLVPEDRKTEGLFLPMSTQSNLSISELGAISRWGTIGSRSEKKFATAAAADVNLPLAMLARNVQDLSGGNQQKVLFGRALLSNPNCLLLFDPTRGVDAATKVEIYHMTRKFADAGGSVFVYSTEIPELVGLCDRVYTIYDGRITGDFDGESLTEDSLMRGALGRLEGKAS
jgi:ribose transport system ATP-binding protein